MRFCEHEINETRTALPRYNRKVVTITGPRKLILRSAKFFQFHCELTLANFIIGEDLDKIGLMNAIRKLYNILSYLKMRSQTQLGQHPNSPFGGIVLVPLDGISVVHGELNLPGSPTIE